MGAPVDVRLSRTPNTEQYVSATEAGRRRHVSEALCRNRCCSLQPAPRIRHATSSQGACPMTEFSETQLQQLIRRFGPNDPLTDAEVEFMDQADLELIGYERTRTPDGNWVLRLMATARETADSDSSYRELLDLAITADRFRMWPQCQIAQLSALLAMRMAALRHGEDDQRTIDAAAVLARSLASEEPLYAAAIDRVAARYSTGTGPAEVRFRG